MGCLHSKSNKVAPAPEDGEGTRHFSLGSRKNQKSSARIRSPIIPWTKRRVNVRRIQVAEADPNAIPPSLTSSRTISRTPSVTPPPCPSPALFVIPSPTPSCEDGRRSVAYTVPYDERRSDSPVPKRRPRRLKPIKRPEISAEILIAKTEEIEARRKKALRKKREFPQKVIRRGNNLARVKHMARSESSQQMKREEMMDQYKYADTLREAHHRDIVEKQRKREERAVQVRKQKTEPLNNNRLTAFIRYDDTKTDVEKVTATTSQQKQASMLEKMAKRTEEVAKEAEEKKVLTNERLEAQLKTALHVQQQRDEKVGQEILQHVKTTEAKIDLTLPGATAAVVGTHPPKDEEIHEDERPLRPASTTQKIPFYRHDSPQEKSSSDNSLKFQLAETQAKATMNRNAKQREVIMKQKWRELKAKEIRRKAKELKEEEEDEEIDFGEIEGDESYGGVDDVDFWGVPYNVKLQETHMPEAGMDDFYDS